MLIYYLFCKTNEDFKVYSIQRTKIIFYIDKSPFSTQVDNLILTIFDTNTLLFDQNIFCSLHFLYCPLSAKETAISPIINFLLYWRVVFKTKIWVLCGHVAPGRSLCLDYLRTKNILKILK